MVCWRIPKRYQDRLRLEEATLQLQASDRQILDIALNTGRPDRGRTSVSDEPESQM